MEFFILKTEDTNLSRNPHNTFARIALDTGFIGITLFLLFLIKLGTMSKRLWRRHRYENGLSRVTYLCLLIAFINLVIAMLFGDVFEQPQIWSIFLLIAVAYKNENPQRVDAAVTRF